MSKQPLPIANDSEHISDLVIEDIKKRKEQGIASYGVALQAFNKRNSVQDAYEEVIDLAQYFKQLLIEREEMINVLRFYSDSNNYINSWDESPTPSGIDGGLKANILLTKLGEL
jgi:deoxycytidine triphosphate deaminase